MCWPVARTTVSPSITDWIRKNCALPVGTSASATSNSRTGHCVVASRRVMRLEHLFDLDLRDEGEYVVVRPYGGQDGIGYAAGTGRATGPRIEGKVPLLEQPASCAGTACCYLPLDGAIATDDDARIVFSSTGLGRKEADGRRFRALLAMTLESGRRTVRLARTSRSAIGRRIVTGVTCQMQRSPTR